MKSNLSRFIVSVVVIRNSCDWHRLYFFVQVESYRLAFISIMQNEAYVFWAIVAVVLIVYVFWWRSSEGMYADNSYDPATGRVVDPGMTFWQSTTQGGFPNYPAGTDPATGATLGRYDYLGKNISGKYLLPSGFLKDYNYYGFKDCGCGCNGQKKADAAISKVSKFGAAPMDPANICNRGMYGTVRGRCAAPREGFGAAPGDELAQTQAVLNMGNRDPASKTYLRGKPPASDVLEYLHEYDRAMNGVADAEASGVAMNQTMAAIAANPNLITSKPKADEHIDAEPNVPRQRLKPGVKGNYAGANTVSALDGRTRD